MNKNLLTQQHLFIAYLVLSVIGVGITASSPAASHYYWFVMVLVFGAGAIVVQYFQLENDAVNQKKHTINQALHWLGGLVVALVVNAYYQSGRIFVEETGLMMLLVLALTLYLDGIKTGWRSCFSGFFLALTAVCASYFDSYVWQLLLLAVTAVVYSFYRH